MNSSTWIGHGVTYIMEPVSTTAAQLTRVGPEINSVIINQILVHLIASLPKKNRQEWRPCLCAPRYGIDSGVYKYRSIARLTASVRLIPSASARAFSAATRYSADFGPIPQQKSRTYRSSSSSAVRLSSGDRRLQTPTPQRNPVGQIRTRSLCVPRFHVVCLFGYGFRYNV